MSDDYVNKDGPCATWWSKTWPPLLVCFAISFIYMVFLLNALIPQINRAFNLSPAPTSPDDPNTYLPSQGEILGIMISFHVLMFMLLLCFLRSGTTPPGSIPLTDVSFLFSSCCLLLPFVLSPTSKLFLLIVWTLCC